MLFYCNFYFAILNFFLQIAEDTEENSPKKFKVDSNCDISLKAESENNNKDLDKNVYKFKTAVPISKQPGHTGFLTFASVPPHLIRNYKTIEENTLHSTNL